MSKAGKSRLVFSALWRVRGSEGLAATNKKNSSAAMESGRTVRNKPIPEKDFKRIFYKTNSKKITGRRRAPVWRLVRREEAETVYYFYPYLYPDPFPQADMREKQNGSAGSNPFPYFPCF